MFSIRMINNKILYYIRMDAPKSVSRPKRWSAEVEDAYRFQLAGYRDEAEYTLVQKVDEVCEQLNTGFIVVDICKKLTKDVGSNIIGGSG